MKSAVLPRWLVAAGAFFFGLWTGGLPSAAALTPDSPQVKKAVAAGLKFLQSMGDHNDPGGKALIGLAMIKGGISRQDAKVQSFAAAVRQAADKPAAELAFPQFYTPGLMTLFLVELDSQRYSRELNTLLQYIISAQKPQGGWGYASGKHAGTSDTSMTQYGVLSLWELKQAGFNVPLGTCESVCLWLLRTQDPSGGYGYQGNVSKDFTPIRQGSVSESLTAAGMGSVYICADLLGFVDRPRKDDGLPPAMREVPQQPAGKTRSSINPNLIRAVEVRGNHWLQEHYTVNPARWPHYYLYAWERYWAFRELAEGGRRADHPNWYHDAATYLLETQNEDGSWDGRESKAITTAFCLLFLVRSSKKSIQKVHGLGAGTLVGGRGLPKDTDVVHVKDGRVVSMLKVESIQKMLSQAVDDDDAKYGDAIRAMAELPPSQVKALLSKQEARLQKLAGGASADQRLAAVAALAKGGRLEDAPTLIYALTDPEPDIVRTARDGLRRISRKFDGFGLPDDPQPEQLQAALRQWKDWYLAIQPDAEFEN